MPDENALTGAGANTEAIDELSRGLRATASSLDLAIIDGATKSLTVKWAAAELQKRQAVPRLLRAARVTCNR